MTPVYNGRRPAESYDDFKQDYDGYEQPDIPEDSMPIEDYEQSEPEGQIEPREPEMEIGQEPIQELQPEPEDSVEDRIASAQEEWEGLRVRRRKLRAMGDGAEKDEELEDYDNSVDMFLKRTEGLDPDEIMKDKRGLGQRVTEFAEDFSQDAPKYFENAAIAANVFSSSELIDPDRHEEALRELGPLGQIPAQVVGLGIEGLTLAGAAGIGAKAVAKALPQAAKIAPYVTDIMADILTEATIGYLHGSKDGRGLEGAGWSGALAGFLSTLTNSVSFGTRMWGGRHIRKNVLNKNKSQIKRLDTLNERAGKDVADIESGKTKYTDNKHNEKPSPEDIKNGIGIKTSERVEDFVDQYQRKHIKMDMESDLAVEEGKRIVEKITVQQGDNVKEVGALKYLTNNIDWLKQKLTGVNKNFKQDIVDKSNAGIKSYQSSIARFKGAKSEGAKKALREQLMKEGHDLGKVHGKHFDDYVEGIVKETEGLAGVEKKKISTEMAKKYVSDDSMVNRTIKVLDTEFGKINDGTPVTLDEFKQFRDNLNTFVRGNEKNLVGTGGKHVFNFKKDINMLYYGQRSGSAKKAARYYRFLEVKKLRDEIAKSDNKYEFIRDQVWPNKKKRRLLMEFSDPNVGREHKEVLDGLDADGIRGNSKVVTEFGERINKRWNPKEDYLFEKGTALDMFELDNELTVIAKRIESGAGQFLTSGTKRSMMTHGAQGMAIGGATGNLPILVMGAIPVAIAAGIAVTEKAFHKLSTNPMMLKALHSSEVQSMYKAIVNGAIPKKEGKRLLNRKINATMRGIARSAGAVSGRASISAPTDILRPNDDK